MKYALKYYTTCPILDKVDEIIIKYNKRDEELINFVQKYPNQRIIVDITLLNDDEVEHSLEIFEAAITVHPDLAILCSCFHHPYYLFADENIPFFFLERINTFDKLTSAICLGVSDVYITDELGFYLIDVHKICAEHEVKVRVYPNVAQSSSLKPDASLTQFFIRPEDIEMYEDYVDVLEFFGVALDKQPVFYNIYNEGQWGDELSILIAGIDPVASEGILPIFGPSRLKCNKRCTFGKCELCINLAKISKDLLDKGIYITKEEKRNKLYESESKIIQASMPVDTESAT